MGIANYTNLSELTNKVLGEDNRISIADMVDEAQARGLILASEGTLADRGDLENGFIALFDVLYHSGAIKPDPANESEIALLKRYESGALAENGYGGPEGDQFLEIKWSALIDNLPVIANINL